MKVLDGIKAISAIVRQYNDLELNQQIIDLTQQALDLVTENARLTAENEELRKTRDIESRIIRHTSPYITLQGEDDIHYCANCWGSQSKLIQVQRYDDEFVCPICNTNGRYKNKRKIQRVNY